MTYIFVKESDPGVQQALAAFPGWDRLWQGGGWTLFSVSNHRLFKVAKRRAAQDASVVRMVPPLHRTLGRLPPGVQNFLGGFGVSFQPGDTVGDLLAQLTGDQDFGMGQ